MNIQLQDKVVFTQKEDEQTLLINGEVWGELIRYRREVGKPFHAIVRLPYQQTTGEKREIAQGLGNTPEEAIEEALAAMQAMVESINISYIKLLTDVAAA